MVKMLIIEPVGGLCNRMYAIHSAANLARTFNCPLTLVWEESSELGARFDQLFKPSAAFLRTYEFCKNRDSLAQYLRRKIILSLFLTRLSPKFQPLQIKNMVEDGFDFESLVHRKRFHIKTWPLFFGSQLDFFPFEPLPDLQQKISEITRTFSKTVGIHIRRSDHKLSRQFSPTHLFLDAMKEELQREPATNFFLSTDDTEEERLLIERFGERVRIYRKRSHARNELEAMQDAVIDLFCLAATERIIGSYESTFTDVASRLGRISLQVINKNSGNDA